MSKIQKTEQKNLERLQKKTKGAMILRRNPKPIFQFFMVKKKKTETKQDNRENIEEKKTKRVKK